MKTFNTFVAATLFGLSSFTFAQTAPAAPVAQAEQKDWSDAEVRKIDIDSGKVTLKHGPIKSLDMPGMTMVFHVKDVALFDKLKVGEPIKFVTLKEGNKYIVTEVMAAK